MYTLLVFALIQILFAADNPSSQSFSRIELTNNLIEDGYSQTSGSFGLLVDVEYRWPQFKLGLRGNNVSFSHDSSHLTLQPYAMIIAHFNETNRLFLEYEQRFYYFNYLRNTSRTSLTFENSLYYIRYESLINWYGFQIHKNRFSGKYKYLWNFDLYSYWGLAYNRLSVDKKNYFFELSADLRYRQYNLEYYGELIILSDVVLESLGQTLNFRLGVVSFF